MIYVAVKSWYAPKQIRTTDLLIRSQARDLNLLNQVFEVHKLYLMPIVAS
jgi:hypothetical protein